MACAFNKGLVKHHVECHINAPGRTIGQFGPGIISRLSGRGKPCIENAQRTSNDEINVSCTFLPARRLCLVGIAHIPPPA